MATIRQSKPLAPNVKLTNPDGTPTREFHSWLTRQYEALATSVFMPASATIAAAGTVGRLVTTMATRGVVDPSKVVYKITDNGGVSVAFTGADLKTTANPAGTVGEHTLVLQAVDGEGHLYAGTLKITLT